MLLNQMCCVLFDSDVTVRASKAWRLVTDAFRALSGVVASTKRWREAAVCEAQQWDRIKANQALTPSTGLHGSLVGIPLQTRDASPRLERPLLTSGLQREAAKNHMRAGRRFTNAPTPETLRGSSKAGKQQPAPARRNQRAAPTACETWLQLSATLTVLRLPVRRAQPQKERSCCTANQCAAQGAGSGTAQALHHGQLGVFGAA